MVIIPQVQNTLYHFTPLSSLQQRLLKLLGFPQTIYTQLVESHFL